MLNTHTKYICNICIPYILPTSWGYQENDSILTWQGRYRDHEGGFPRARLIHCTPDVLNPAISPNVVNSTAEFVVVRDCVRVFPRKEKKKGRESDSFIFSLNNCVWLKGSPNGEGMF